MESKYEAAFWNKVNKTDSCWEWTAAKSNGYGVCAISNTKIEKAHRFSWMIAFGKIPDGLFVCHKCDNRGCVRPEHLFVGTNHDNVKDMISKKRNSPPPPMGGWNKILIPDWAIEKIGKQSDKSIANELMVSKTVIRRIRKKLGIEKFPVNTRFKKGDPHPRWSRLKGGYQP